MHVGNAREFSKAASTKLPENCEVQLFDADFVATWQHLYFATINALMNQKNGRGVSKSIAVETAVYASAQRQIRKALELIGVKSHSKNIAILLICETQSSAKAALKTIVKLLDAEPDESVLELSEAKVQTIRKAFDVSEAELSAISTNRSVKEALVDLVLELVALVSTRL